MNRLARGQRVQVLSALVEGNSIRATVRMTGVAKNTVTKLLVDAGAASAAYQADNLRGLTCKRVQCDEIWAFCHSKEKNVPEEQKGELGYGDVWTWAAIDADTKLVAAFTLGDRSASTAHAFMVDLAKRLKNRVQLTTDGHRVYLEAVDNAFAGDIDYAMLMKKYGETATREGERRYSPAQYAGSVRKVIVGDPDGKHIATSYVAGQYTRLTNGFSKKIENMACAVSVHFMYYNFARPHVSLKGQTPAMAAGVADHVWTLEEILALVEADESSQNSN